MCGIVGVFAYKNNDPVDRELLKKSNDLIVHRGPDGEGFYFDDPNGVGLAHRRLSIVDIEGGTQPMSNEDDTIFVTYNGEIYNYPELKEKLQSKHKFKTRCDTEIILHAYEEWGDNFIKQLNGIFAFALWDANKKILILARDPFGVKPLYYYDDGSKVIFSSEIRSIKAYPDCNTGVDSVGINNMLAYRFIKAPYTGFKNIRKIRPGYYLSVQKSGCKEIPYFHIDISDKKYSFSEAQEALGEKINKAIYRQLMSDVPIAIYLSGGVDSSYIAKTMSGKVQGFLNINMEFKNNAGMNEGIYAKEVSDSIKSKYHQIIIGGEEYMSHMEQYIRSIEEPVTNLSAISWYFLSKAARNNNIKVVLSGQGSDEILGGYNKYIGEKYHHLFKALDNVGGRSIFNFITWALPYKYQYNNQFQRSLNSLGIKDDSLRFLEIFKLVTDKKRKTIFKDEFFCDVNFTDLINPYIEKLNGTDSLNKIMIVDTFTNLSDNLLAVGDKLNMANSVEMRVPFLDIELVNFAFSLPGHYKIKLFHKKYIYKKYLEKFFKKEFIYRPKIGFYSPVNTYFNQPAVKHFLFDLINAQNSFTNTFLKKKEVDILVSRHYQNKENNRWFLYQLLTLEIWYKIFFKS